MAFVAQELPTFLIEMVNLQKVLNLKKTGRDPSEIVPVTHTSRNPSQEELQDSEE